MTLTLKQQVFNILVQKQNTVLIEKPTTREGFGSQTSMALTMQVNFESLGYSLSPEVIRQLSFKNPQELEQLYFSLSKVLKENLGAHHAFQPMYPNFPEQVMNASNSELLINALIHYTGDLLSMRILPEYSKKQRFPSMDYFKVRVLELADVGAEETLFVRLLNSNASLSATDKNYLNTLFSYLEEQGRVVDLLNESKISQKEILAYASTLAFNNPTAFQTLSTEFSTTTDVLRFAVALMDGDTSLAADTKFKKFSRPQRRAVLSLLEQVIHGAKDREQSLENLFSYREQWLRLGETIHPGEYAKQFPDALSVFNILRSQRHIETYNSRVQKAFEDNKYDYALDLLAQRPGVLARNLNRLLQSLSQTIAVPNKNTFSNFKPTSTHAELVEKTLSTFDKAAFSVSTPVLLQVHNHFLTQSEKTVRTFLPKGAISKAFVTDVTSTPILEELAQRVVNSCEQALIARFSQLPALGKVYVDPILKGQILPFAMRSANKTLKTVARGSQIPAEESNITRLFLWWNESETVEGKTKSIGRVDIDLSAVVMDEDFKTIGQCTFYNLRDQGITHSGDITSAPNGACEFIDIDKTKLDPRAQYIVMSINSYTSHPYCDIPECFAGWMKRDNAQHGEIFDPRSVVNKIDLASDQESVSPMIFDVKNNKIIWADIGIKTSYYYNNIADNQLGQMAYLVKGLVNINKPNLFNLFELHAKARGELVSDKEQADTVFSLHEGITPYQQEVITSDFMADKISAPSPKMK